MCYVRGVCVLRQGNTDASNTSYIRRNCSSCMYIIKNSWCLTKTVNGMTNSVWNQIYTKLLPPACKENNGEKSIDLHLSTISKSPHWSGSQWQSKAPSENQNLHPGLIRIMFNISKKIMHLLFFNAKFVLFAQNINLEKKLASIMKCVMNVEQLLRWEYFRELREAVIYVLADFVR